MDKVLPKFRLLTSLFAVGLICFVDLLDANELGSRSRGTPRVANRLLKRVRDYAQVLGDGKITRQLTLEALSRLEIDSLGLDDIDHRLLRSIIEKFSGGPVGLDTLAASISEEADTIMDIYEPYLLQLGFLERTPRGRSATANAQSDDEDALRAEVEAVASQLGEALNTSDGELFDTLWLQSDKTTYFPPSQPFRVDGWPEVRQPFAGLLGLPPGAVNVVVRQERIDLVGDDVAIRTGHFILRIRPPGGTTRTINGRFSRVYRKWTESGLMFTGTLQPCRSIS